MNSEEIIVAFLSVWEKRPELFNSPDVSSDSLEDLQNQLIELETASDDELAKCLDNWCENYDAITDAVDEEITRKLKGADNDSSKTEDHSIINQYPKITQVLRTRAPKMGKKEGKS